MQDLMGIFMDAPLLVQLFLGGGIKALQEFAETDNMYQFMGDDIKAKGKQFHVR